MFDDILGNENEVDEIIYDDQRLPTEDEDEEIILYDASEDDGSVPTLEEVLEEVKDFFDYHAEKE